MAAMMAAESSAVVSLFDRVPMAVVCVVEHSA